MQAAAPKHAKKPSFKCPAFSVPAKPKADKSVIKNTPEKSHKQVKLKVNAASSKEQSPTNLTLDGDNQNNSDEESPEQPKSDHDHQQSRKQPKSDHNRQHTCTQHKPDGDNKSSISESPKDENISMTGDCERSTHSKNEKNGTEQENIRHGEALQSSAENVKKDNGNVVKRKKKAEFKVKAATEEGEMKTDKVKKKKEIVGNAGDTKQKKDTELKKPKEKREVTRNKPKMTLPVRSLTDEEYCAIFEGAVENALNLDIEEWEPKGTPAKVKKPVGKKYSITVGKKVSEHSGQNISKESQELCQEQNKEIEDELPEVSVGAGDEENQMDEKQEQVAVVEGQINEDNNIVEDREVDGDNAVVVIEVDDLEDGPVQESAQKENETTPAGSEVDPGENQPDCVNTPVKKKKLPKVAKQPKLEPKQLPFERKSEAFMVDKIQQMKKMNKGNNDVYSKKRKLEPDTKIAEKVQTKVPDLLKEKNRQKSSKKVGNKRQKMLQRELELNGTWVQCCNSTCMKWRYLPDINDPILIPERWTCSMNQNKEYNSCAKAEENYDESEHIYTKFAEGSVVWARVTGYPWWPAMVEIDPNAETYFSIDTYDSMCPTHYHVVFFDEHVSRAWVRTEQIKMFSGNEDEDGILYQVPKKGASYTKDIATAKKNALRALGCTIKERIELFGFAAKYKGPWSSKSKDTKKSTKLTARRKSADVEEDCLDDSTMNDVLDNSEALLDNVEEILESLGSQLLDSDADSDFVPEELVVVEKKRKEPGITCSSKEIKGMKTLKIDALDSEIDINTLKDKAVSERDESSKTKLEADEESISSNVASTKLNFDSDIFTMEMGSQDYNFTASIKTDGVPINKAHVKPSKINTTNDTQKKAVEFQVNASTNEEIKIQKIKEKKKPCMEQSKVKPRKENKRKVEKQKKVVSESGESPGLKKSMLQKEVAEEKDLIENSFKTKEESEGSPALSVKELNVDTETDKGEMNSDDNEKRGDHEAHNKEFIEEGEDCNDRTPKSIYDKKTEEDVDKRSKELENGVLNKYAVDDFADLSDIEVDVCSNNIVENDRMVPDLDVAGLPTQLERNSGQNLDDGSDSEFDLEEHFMYETNTDGSDKVRERALSVEQGISEVEEDSDPFDLIEE